MRRGRISFRVFVGLVLSVSFLAVASGQSDRTKTVLSAEESFVLMRALGRDKKEFERGNFDLKDFSITVSEGGDAVCRFKQDGETTTLELDPGDGLVRLLEDRKLPVEKLKDTKRWFFESVTFQSVGYRAENKPWWVVTLIPKVIVEVPECWSDGPFGKLMPDAEYVLSTTKDSFEVVRKTVAAEGFEIADDDLGRSLARINVLSFKASPKPKEERKQFKARVTASLKKVAVCADGVFLSCNGPALGPVD